MSPLRQTARPHLTGEEPGTSSLELLTRQEQRPIRLVAQPDTRPFVPISELVLIDQHEAQGWRVRQNQRLDHLFEERCDWVRRYGPVSRLAVDSGEVSLTYDELDARANRLARYLRLQGAVAGDRIALLFDSPADTYIAMLAVLKIGAAYVPLDVSFPADRMAYIVEDARVRMVLSMSGVADRVAQIELLTVSAAELVYLDRAAPLIDEQDSRRLIDAERGILDNQLAYIIYPSSSHGRSVGVAVDHPSICNFVKVAAEVYGIRPGDRVYQGLTVAFGFSVEEIWVPWVCGATLVPQPPGASLLGRDLHRFLSERRVTAMCCVPTLLASIEGDLPDLRFLLVSGETCPQDLIARWYLPGRRFLNVYGPAEATVTATWTELHPDKPVTIGIPLPTYSTVVLDVENPYRALPHGEIGEIGIAGIGLACGYLNRDDLTEQAFIRDFLDIPANPSGRIYRTGDLGRVNTDGEIEYHGRIEPRGGMHGYRTELAEIEPALQVPELTPAVVDAADSAESSTAHGACTEPTAGTEEKLAVVLADLVGVERVSVESNFFDDLGADSMVMARFCARARKRTDLPAVSMQDVYRNPTIRGLATALAGPAPAPAEPSVPASIEVARPTSALQYVLCGTLQLLLFLGISYLSALVVVRGFEWIIGGSSLVDVYLRSVLFGGATFVGLCALPVLAKWLLIGRWKPQQIPVWSMAYVRFWIVKTLVRSNPLARFVGSPLYVCYLRALGAKVGRGVAIFSRTVPVCTDLLSIGDGTVIRKDSSFTCYRAHAGEIQTGTVTIGKDALIGEATVLDIGTSLGDGAQLGHSSSLHARQAVPDGERWHGSPAQRTEVDYRAIETTDCGTLRRVVFSALQLLFMLVVSAPLGIGGVTLLLAAVPQFGALLDSGTLDLTVWTFYRDALVVSSVIFFGTVLVGLLFLVTVPRVLNLAIKPDKVYRLYGFHYWIHLAIARVTNRKFFTHLFGDSSYIVHYLRYLGYDLSRVVQTGSNFGLDVKHENPYLSSVGSGTMVADGLSIINSDFSSSSFRVSRVSIGQHNFLGNKIAYPAQGRTGDNCLLATKVMVPLDGKIREGIGLLGSPSFEIPRSVERDTRLDLNSTDELRRRLAAKNKHNAVTMGLYLLVRWIFLFGVIVLAMGGVDLYESYGASMIALSNVGILLLTVAYFVLVDRCVRVLQVLRPLGCSIYDRSFWRHERFWKVRADGYLPIFNGTPFKNVIWRLLGVRIGHRVFDDGCYVSERTFVTIGDGCTLNAESHIQCHSQEDGAFKSDRSTIGAGCTLGVGGFVHYGVTMGDGAVLAPDSFLMKGEEIPQRARWGGNPAREIRHDPAGVRPEVPTCLALR